MASTRLYPPEPYQGDLCAGCVGGVSATVDDDDGGRSDSCHDTAADATATATDTAEGCGRERGRDEEGLEIAVDGVGCASWTRAAESSYVGGALDTEEKWDLGERLKDLLRELHGLPDGDMLGSEFRYFPVYHSTVYAVVVPFDFHPVVSHGFRGGHTAAQAPTHFQVRKRAKKLSRIFFPSSTSYLCAHGSPKSLY